jgi:hypothetical protein
MWLTAPRLLTLWKRPVAIDTSPPASTAPSPAARRATHEPRTDLRSAAPHSPEPSAPIDQQAAAVDAQHAALDLVV